MPNIFKMESNTAAPPSQRRIVRKMFVIEVDGEGGPFVTVGEPREGSGVLLTVNDGQKSVAILLGPEQSEALCRITAEFRQ